MDNEKMIQLIESLNESQQKAVFSDSRHIVCLAGAGTGKTHSMLSRIKRLVMEGVDPESILVLTFTNAAAFEMRRRFSKTSDCNTSPEFRTFHSFCYSLISKDNSVRMSLGYSRIPKVTDSTYDKKLNGRATAQCGIKPTPAMLLGKVDLSPKDKKDIEIFNKTRMRIMKQDNLITFNYMCNGVCKMFQDRKPFIEKYLEKYKYIFVDEFQDTDKAQFNFVMSFFDTSYIFVVGDALQNIYSFRGSDNSIIKSLVDDENWTVIKLQDNYRSTVQICNFANKMSTYADEKYRIEIHSKRDGSNVQVMRLKSPYSVTGSVMRNMCDKLKGLEGYTAILCRTNNEVNTISDYLQSAGISHMKGKQNDEYIHLIRCMYDDAYMLEWLSTFLDSEKYSEFIRLQTITSEDREYTIVDFMHAFGRVWAVSTRYERVFQLRNLIAEARPPIQNSVKDIIKVLGLSDKLITKLEFVNMTEFLNWLSLLSSEEEDLDDTNVYVGTVHSSKGLEYDNVILVGVNSDTFRLQSEDDNNLYYVGITRAKNNLIVYRNNES